MNCIAHPNSEAVGTCGICGAGLCHDCFTGTFYTWNGMPLCPSCNVSLVSELAAEARAEAASARMRVLFFVVAVAIGLGLAAASGEPAAILGLASLGAIPTMWRLTRPMPSQVIEYAVQDGVEQAFGDYSGGPIRFIVRLFLVLALSGIASVILFFVALWKWRKAARQAAAFEADLAAMQMAGWRAEKSAEASVPADPKKVALVRAIHFAGPWKRNAPTSAPEAIGSPGSARKGASPSDAVKAAALPVARAQSAPADRIATRMAEVDARIAARKASLESRSH